MESTVGVMAPGQYTFGTRAPERMTVVKGALTIKRVTDADWVTFTAGEAFEVAGNSSFDLQKEVATAYLCEFCLLTLKKPHLYRCGILSKGQSMAGHIGSRELCH